MKPRIWVVGEPVHPSIHQWGEVVNVPAVVIDTPEGAGYKMRRRYDRHTGIRQAMSDALHFAELGDLIMQNDVELLDDPFAGKEWKYHVRTLVAPLSDAHVCPQAFIVYDEETREEVLDVWNGSRHQACVAWCAVPFVEDYVVAVHRGQPGVV